MTPQQRARLWRRLLIGCALIAGSVVLGLAFVAYQQPELLMDFSNLSFCG